MKMALRKSRLEDREQIRTLLDATKLPAETVDTDATTFYIAEQDDRVVGIAGLEHYGNDALLRSVAVPAELQRKGIGSVIVDLMLEEAAKLRVENVVLLTETAKDFFLKKGFSVIERSTITNQEMKKSSEFAQVCPESAVCMAIKLRQKEI